MEQPLTEKDLEPREPQEQVGVIISNPAWLKYKRRYDTVELPDDDEA